MAAHTPPDAAFAPSVQPDQPATAWAPWLRQIAGAVNQLGAKTTELAAIPPGSGPPGPTGPAGPAGATGATGPAGSANMSGMVAGQFPVAASATTVTSSAMTWDAVNTRLGIGTAAPSSALDVSSGAAGTQINIHNSTSGNTVTDGFQLSLGGVNANVWNYENGSIVFATNNFQQMAIDAAGRVNVGGTFSSTRRLGVRAVGVTTANDYVAEFTNTNNTAGDGVVIIGGGPTAVDTTTKLVWFLDQAFATVLGAITRNGAAAVAYGTASDERLKEAISDSQIGLEELMQVKVRDYNFKLDDRREHGLIAQEVAQVYPLAVHQGGDDPATDPWMIDYGRLTPLLIKSIQQQQTEITTLRQRLATLEGRVEVARP